MCVYVCMCVYRCVCVCVCVCIYIYTQLIVSVPLSHLSVTASIVLLTRYAYFFTACRVCVHICCVYRSVAYISVVCAYRRRICGDLFMRTFVYIIYAYIFAVYEDQFIQIPKYSSLCLVPACVIIITSTVPVALPTNQL